MEGTGIIMRNIILGSTRKLSCWLQNFDVLLHSGVLSGMINLCGISEISSDETH